MATNGAKQPFKLNAPQATDDGVEDRDSFISIGDALENPPSVPFKGKKQPSLANISEQGQPQPQPEGYTSNDPRVAAALAAANGGGEDGELSPEELQRLPLKCLIIVGLLVIALLIGLIVVVAVALTGSDKNSNPNAVTPTDLRPPPTRVPSLAPATAGAPVNMEPTPEPATTLGRVAQKGILRCGIPEQPGFASVNLTTGFYEGFDVDLCRAVAAAIFGEDGHVELNVLDAFGRFTALANDDVDMLARTTTVTMERQVFEATTEGGFSFSVPYLYNGLQFAGVPLYVECADNFTARGNCSDVIVCVLDGTTHQAEITNFAPDLPLVSVVNSANLYRSFIDGFCNVIAGEQFDIAETQVRTQGYSGDYALGTQILTKEPLALVTRDDDPQWSDFVNWVLQALLAAEEEGISARTANIIGTTDVFGEQFANMFINAVKVVGNYGEIYDRHLEPILPRPPQDHINNGGSGVIYAYPFGSLAAVGPSPVRGGTLELITSRGHLRCGISLRAIFALEDTSAQTWSGFDVDFCRALSAALFDGVTDTVEFSDLSASARFVSLQSGDVDVLSRLTTVNLARDVFEPAAMAGFSFSLPNFYDGLTFGGIPPYVSCADRLDVTSLSCRDLLICVNQGTTFESRLKTLFPERFIIPQESVTVSIEKLGTGECNTIAGGVVDVSLTSIRGSGYDGSYQIGRNRYSKDPLALVSRQDDAQWSSFVFWVVSAIFFAEEQGITQATASEMPTVNLFGTKYANMLQNVIAAVGNYGEIYERNAEADVPRGGLNLINELLMGPEHYPLPGVVE